MATYCRQLHAYDLCRNPKPKHTQAYACMNIPTYAHASIRILRRREKNRPRPRGPRGQACPKGATRRYNNGGREDEQRRQTPATPEMGAHQNSPATPEMGTHQNSPLKWSSCSAHVIKLELGLLFPKKPLAFFMMATCSADGGVLLVAMSLSFARISVFMTSASARLSGFVKVSTIKASAIVTRASRKASSSGLLT